ncbi:MAG TPA: adenylate/guanylate cyclase domain-containing protein, partial [Candidatus Dormibacteraeota bacterium]|nr:adenylate/guanylate cyclase domain-containing protein [Candidatus Dormibacteraeota bacterium]
RNRKSQAHRKSLMIPPEMAISGAPTPTRPAGSSERRPLTVLFADIAGSTSIAEHLDPEDWTALVGEAFQSMNKTIERYGGTIARLMGDGVLAFFGAPVAHEDDPERAIRCGLDMVRAIDDLEASEHKRGTDKLRVRVGINTGPVVVGIVGTETASEYTAMGDTVNVAARMQATARPGSVLVTANTYRFIASLVDATDVGMLELKGKTDAVHAYEITALKTNARSTRGLAGVTSPMVGRDAELRRLEQLYEVVRAGQGRVACIVGEPGMGKSRLLAELRVSLERSDPPPRWVEARCLSYGEALPYSLLLELVRSIIGVTATTDEPEVAQALESFLAANPVEDRQETYAYLGHLLSLHLSPDMHARISGLEMETIKRYNSSSVQIVRAAVSSGAMVLVCDDVHWADGASVETLLQILSAVAGLPILFIVSSRPERTSAGWRLIAGARDTYGDALTELRLEPLSVDDSRTLVSNLLTIESLPEPTRDLILARAEGNPFFVEEVIRMLIDRGAIVREGDRWIATDKVAAIEIPDTLHGLLLARIDRLPAESRRTLRVASVIGRQFGVTILEKLLEPEPK